MEGWENLCGQWTVHHKCTMSETNTVRTKLVHYLYACKSFAVNELYINAEYIKINITICSIWYKL